MTRRGRLRREEGDENRSTGKGRRRLKRWLDSEGRFRGEVMSEKEVYD